MELGAFLLLSAVFAVAAGLTWLIVRLSPEPETLMGLMGWIGPWLAPLHSTIQRDMVIAGLSGRLTPERVIGLQVILAIGLGAAGAVGGWPLACVAFSLGLLAPRWHLRQRGVRRQQAIFRDLPYTIDLLTVVVEAGHDFGMALAKVTEKIPPGPLKEELARTMSELRLGRPRREALRELAARVNLHELSTLAMALIQTDQLGASLGPALRVQADELRQARARRAERLALEAPVKMLVPLLGCIFPAVFIVLLLPIGLALLGHVP